MGTDIHGGFIKVTRNFLDNEIREQKPVKTNWKMDRNYALFAILAGVRNGYGFAGVTTHEPLQPITEGRGIPSWLATGITRVNEYYDPDVENPNEYQKNPTEFCEDYAQFIYNKYEDNDTLGEWLGEHSQTYMTVDEILNWSGWDQHLSRSGCVSLNHYKETLAQGKDPESWCGAAGGPNVCIIEEEDLYQIPFLKEKNYYVHCQWKEKESLRENFSWFLKEINRIKENERLTSNQEIYLVVGFDS